MFNEVIYVVGAKFNALSELANVITFDEYKLCVEQKKLDPKTIVVLAQGLNAEEKDQVMNLTRTSTANIVINAYNKPAPSQYTHKKDVKNILVSDPVVLVSGKKFRSRLLIDDDCSEMSDHVTGVHIQGMLLVEAARQLSIAVSEKFLLDSIQSTDCYFLLKSINTQFNRFIFPVDVSIEHQILDIKTLKGGFKDIVTQTAFIQNNIVATQVDMEFRINAKHILTQTEYQIARETIIKNTAIVTDEAYFDRVG